jgi:lipid II:glycine glycyltransferase (peptidoglycan interpeptide bridge formation enzyme)
VTSSASDAPPALPAQEAATLAPDRPRVVEVTSEPAEAWDALAVRSPRGEALQSHAWGEVKRAAGWTPRRYRIEDAAGPVAVVAVQERALAAPVVGRLPGAARYHDRAGAFGRFVYAPLGPVLLRDDPGAAIAALHGLRAVARARHAALLLIDPSWPADAPLAEALAASGFARARRPVQVSTTATLVPLERDEAAQWKHLNANARRNVERCRKAGVAVERMDAGTPGLALERALGVAYEMLAETGRRKGFGDRLRPASYHNPAQQRLVEAGHASLWLARVGGEEVAHTLVHHCGRRALLFQAGEREAGQRRVPANFLLQWSIIRWAAGSGFTAYDMGGVDNHDAPGLPTDESHPLWNLYRFKSQWGARGVQLVGAWEVAPWPLLGRGLRAAWAASDRWRERRVWVREAALLGEEGSPE